jgi:hypothetical protein
MKLVISMSFGVDYPNTFAQTAIKTLAAERQDVIWFASAGNSGDDTLGCPACYPEVISVAAVDWNGKLAGFSTRNSAVDLAAPVSGLIILLLLLLLLLPSGLLAVGFRDVSNHGDPDYVYHLLTVLASSLLSALHNNRASRRCPLCRWPTLPAAITTSAAHATSSPPAQPLHPQQQTTTAAAAAASLQGPQWAASRAHPAALSLLTW